MTITLISNKHHLTRQYTPFVDSCDKVMRINKMENLDTGLAGTRTDMALVSLHQGYFNFSRPNRHAELLNSIPELYFFPDAPWMAVNYAFGEGIEKWEALPQWMHVKVRKLTACGAGIVLARHLYPEATIYFLGDTNAWQRTPSFGGGHTCNAENAMIAELTRQGALIPILEEELGEDENGTYSRPLNAEEHRNQQERLLSFGTRPFTEYVAEVIHPRWKDVVRIRGDRACQVQGGYKATVLACEGLSFTLKWDRWGTETFIRHEDGYFRPQPQPATLPEQ